MSKTTVVAAAVAVGVLGLTGMTRAVSARSTLPPMTPSAAFQFAESAADRIPLLEFKRLYDAGAVVVIDVRGSAPYRDGHIPGSVSVPLDTVGQRAAEWKDEARPVVTYCS